MSYATEAAKPTNTPIALFELDIGKTGHGFVSHCAPHVYKLKLYFQAYDIADAGFEEAFIFSPFEGDGAYTAFNDTWFAYLTSVGSVQENGEEITEKSSLADCISDDGSWYFDASEQMLYVHPTGSIPVHLNTYTVGAPLKVTSHSIAASLGEGYYEERIRAIPALRKAKDPHTSGFIASPSGSVELGNADGGLDRLVGFDVFGQQARLKWGYEGLAYADFKEVIKDYVEGFELGTDTVTIKLRDDRRRLARKLPVNRFDKVTYPNLADKYVGKVIPIFYGQVYDAEVICVNSEEGGSPNWTFKVCDVADHSNGIEAIDTVYVDGSSVTPASTDLTNGTVTLNNADWSGERVTFDGQGLHDSGDSYIQTILNVIEDLLSVYLDIAYNATNYDTSEWTTAESNALNNNCGLWMDEQDEAIEWIEKLTDSSGGHFIRKNDGKYTFRFTNVNASADYTILIDDELEEPTVEPDTENLLTSIAIGYAKRQTDDEFRWYLEDSDRDRFYARFSKDQNLEKETLLVSSTDAQELALFLRDMYDAAEPIVRIVVWSEFMDIEIMDVISFAMQRMDGSEIIASANYEVIGFNKDILAGTVEIEMRKLN